LSIWLIYFTFYFTQGITVDEKARRYGISTTFAEPVDSVDKDLVLQYEVALQDGLECGGAYLKFFTADDSFDGSVMNEKTPYSVMFGPDKCGTTNKVHLILRHENPVSGEWEEKHLKSDVPIRNDREPHLYTAVLRRDKSFEIFIDSDSVKSGKIKDEFVAYVNGEKKTYGFEPPQEIDDPEDVKPEDWVDEAKIKDPEASKPDDWDEDAPKQILDEDAEKPEGWNDDEPDFIPDPEAEMPEDWDEEEDGEWEAPMVENPACEVGCGEWQRPMIDNPDYKGKWIHPMIDNPDFVGVWAPRKIPNPAYFSEETHPEAFKTLVAPIGGVSVEIWTMSSGIHFDNIYVGNDVAAAAEWAEQSFGTERAREKALKATEAAEKRRAARTKLLEEGGFVNILNYYMGEVGDLVADNVIATVVTAIALLAVSVRMCCWCDDDDITSTSFEDDADEEEEEEEEEDGAEDGDATKDDTAGDADTDKVKETQEAVEAEKEASVEKESRAEDTPARGASSGKKKKKNKKKKKAPSST
tara:strand:+ start:2627 stop:4204 length:1578 start_codon:yes stop_codon:yes gene_type:complete